MPRIVHDQAEQMDYFTNAITKVKVHYGQIRFAIGVLKSPGIYVPVVMV
jgi:hypothetical protein